MKLLPTMFLAMGVCGIGFSSHSAVADDSLLAPDWSVPNEASARAALEAWLVEVRASDALAQRAIAAWDESVRDDRLLAAATAIAVVRNEVQPLLQECSHPPLVSAAPVDARNATSTTGKAPAERGEGPSAPNAATSPESALVSATGYDFLRDGSLGPFAVNNLRLFYGRFLAQHRLYDEALVQLDGLLPQDVVDPSSLLFYQSIVYQRLLKQELGVQSLRRLLQRQAELPRRYRMVADLMHADLAKLEEESLDHIARRMEDIGRRLDLGRSDQKVREIEDGVVASLDKLIKQLEDEAQKRQQQQASSAQSGGNKNPSKPAQDSMPADGKGAGDVTKKEVVAGEGWGNLSPKQRQEVLQQVTKEFPAHYREVIEQYFRTLADEEGKAGGK